MNCLCIIVINKMSKESKNGMNGCNSSANCIFYALPYTFHKGHDDAETVGSAVEWAAQAHRRKTNANRRKYVKTWMHQFSGCTRNVVCKEQLRKKICELNNISRRECDAIQRLPFSKRQAQTFGGKAQAKFYRFIPCRCETDEMRIYLFQKEHSWLLPTLNFSMHL